jgi:hypothetical protein
LVGRRERERDERERRERETRESERERERERAPCGEVRVNLAVGVVVEGCHPPFG